jgi:hypothetical protein
MWEPILSELFDPPNYLGARVLSKQPADLGTVAKLQDAFNNGG